MLLNMVYIPAVAEAPLVEIYVSANGSDSASGGINEPVTLTKARELMYAKRKAGNRVDIHIEEGTYVLSSPLEFTEGYSGTEQCPVRFVADGEVIITTATEIQFDGFAKITDDDIRDGIKATVRNKIYKVNLSDYGITAGDMPVYSGIDIKGAETDDKFLTYTGDNYDDVSVFTESTELPVAQYPNGEGNYLKWLSITGDKSFSVEKAVSDNWESEKFAYFEGYPGYEYSCERNNVTVSDGIVNLVNPIRSSMRRDGSNRYKIKHMLYELDVPGEWYIDRETNVLYIYPTESVKEKGISVTANKMSPIRLRKANYLTFEGITFDRIRGNAVLGTYNANSVTFKNCTFSNISNQAIFIRADGNTAQYSAYLKSSNFTGGAKNFLIDSNKFINIGSNAIEIYGGTRESLTNSNNIISNNYVYNASSKQKCNPNIIMRGFGGKIINNEIHSKP